MICPYSVCLNKTLAVNIDHLQVKLERFGLLPVFKPLNGGERKTEDTSIFDLIKTFYFFPSLIAS